MNNEAYVKMVPDEIIKSNDGSGFVMRSKDLFMSKVNTFSPSLSMKDTKIVLTNKLRDGWLLLVGIPLVAFILTFLFYSDEWLTYGNSFAYCYFTKLTTTTIIWYINREVLLYFRRRFPSIENIAKRIFLQLSTSIVVTTLISLATTQLYALTNYWNRPITWQDTIYNLVLSYLFVLIVSGIYETVYYFAHWRLSVKEAEELKKANLQSQFESLKSQVSPHFLFNSLNTLSSLIEENPDMAVKFVNQLSKVYRYLLQSNEKELTSLKDEIDFLDSYIFLLKTRFGEGFTVKMDVSDELLATLIPPLTLQILVENAVKHNVVSIHKPLNITIASLESGTIAVVNNLQKKTINVASTGMGLANIVAKYRLLNKPSIRIEEGSNEFSVTLPII